jgi:hypothetical protein
MEQYNELANKLFDCDINKVSNLKSEEGMNILISKYIQLFDNLLRIDLDFTERVSCLRDFEKTLLNLILDNPEKYKKSILPQICDNYKEIKARYCEGEYDPLGENLKLFEEVFKD